ncbi:DUF1906 domain-containing protein [Paenibacillus sp. UNC451MF]|uniref:DUF1906 domain-containing protein n=1 Tax=Paenibacillus sp. UNC451MF TaxID=1449063 RepID=UPI00048B959F|nr:DUF1906 domain-containing protein [Paenibacillus sp. UNC451MF]
MAKGFDCATPLSLYKAKEFFEQGYSFVCRYLAPEGSWKRLSASEAQHITSAGLWIVSVFERGADNALAGAVQGAEDGKLALQYAQEIGQPEGTVIYAAVDTDVNPSHYDVIEAYLRAFDEQITGYELGVYGEYEICKVMQERCIVSKVWQTYAWSRGAKLDNPNIYQYQNDIVVNETGIDLDESNGDAGGWKTGMAIKNAVPELPTAIANNIIDSYLSLAWENCEKERYLAMQEGRTQDAAAWMNLRDWQHRLANTLRRSSGQLVE